MNTLILTNNLITLDSTGKIVAYALSLVLIFLSTFFVAYKIKRARAFILFTVLDLGFAASCLFQNRDILSLVLLRMIFICRITRIQNTGIIRQYLIRPLKKGNTSSSRQTSGTDEETIKNVTEAVRWLSRSKTGALITFEKKTPRNEYRKNGTIINCPVTPEIIETIFYEGTRLHDGAIIIRGDKIVAAAVYYPPSTKVIEGKFGARHRAALGISQEVTDSVTILVSEETGRIGIAHGGVRDRVTSDEFSQVLHNALR